MRELVMQPQCQSDSDHSRGKAQLKLWSNYGPVIVSEDSESGLGSHPRRVVSVSYQQIVGCHGRGRGFESRRPRHSFESS